MSDTEDKTPLTTGEELGRFHKELISNGLPEETAAEIVRDAASVVIREDLGFSIRKEAANV